MCADLRVVLLLSLTPTLICLFLPHLLSAQTFPEHNFPWSSINMIFMLFTCHLSVHLWCFYLSYKRPEIYLSSSSCCNKPAWYCNKSRPIDQWNRTEFPEINPHICVQLIFNKGAKNAQGQKGRLLKKWHLENYWYTNAQKSTQNGWMALVLD